MRSYGYRLVGERKFEYTTQNAINNIRLNRKACVGDFGKLPRC